MNIRLWSLTVAWLLFAACSDRNAELAPDYFSGEIAGTSDSLVFRDCATSVDYLLSEKGAYRAVAARYGRLAGPRRRVYLACRRISIPTPCRPVPPSGAWWSTV